MISKQRDRKCASCRYYEASPLWRKGWCRNPLLYDPQTNHLVEADTLACSRTFIDYWEPKEGSRKKPMIPLTEVNNPRVAPSIPMQPTGPGGTPLRTGGSLGGQPLGQATARASVTQPVPQPQTQPQLSIVRPETQAQPVAETGFVVEDVPTHEVAPAPNAAATQQVPVVVPAVATPAVKPKPANPAQEWIFANRLRTILLALIAIALLILIGGNLIKNRTATPIVASVFPTPTPFAVFLVPTDTVLVVAPTATIETIPPTAAPPAAPSLHIGGAAVASGLNGQRLRVRRDPTTKADIVGNATEGANLTIVAGPTTADGITWWQVAGWDKVNTTGWVSGQFLKPTN